MRMRGAETTTLDPVAISETLASIPDPCSLALGEPCDIVTLGLVEEVVFVDQGVVRIELVLTDPACIFSFAISETVETRLREIGVDGVHVHFAEILWTGDRMYPQAGVHVATKQRGG